MRRNFYVCGLLLLLLGITSAPLFSQEGRGTILGLVTDQSGSVVPGATVSVVNAATNILTTTLSDTTGNYNVPFLPPGTYKVSVEARGFASSVNPSITLNVQESLRLDFALRVGSSTETVTVSAQAPMLETENAATAQTVNSDSVIALPLASRDIAGIDLLVPGMVSSSNATSHAIAAVFGGGIPLAGNGIRPGGDAFTLDGASINVGMYNYPAILPPPDTISEVSIQTGTYSAEYGQFPGAHVDYVLKSGTNAFHGTAWEFVENNDLDAITRLSSVAVLKQNQFGAQLGGPIQKNKTFFFAAYQGLRLASALLDVGIVPTLAQRQGNLALTTAGTPYAPFINPATGIAYPNNVISTIAPQAQAALQYLIPLPTSTSAVDWRVFNSQPQTTDMGFMKIDHSFGEKDQLGGRYANWHNFTTPVLGASGVGIFAFNTEPQRVQNAALIETHSFSPSIVLASRVSWNRAATFQLYPQVGPTLNTSTLFDMPIPSTIGPGNIMNAYPQFGISGFSAFGNAGNAPTYQYDENYEIATDLAFLEGKHTLKTGISLFRFRSARYVNEDSNGILSFAATNPAGTGNALADFLVGLPSGTTIASNPEVVDLRHTSVDVYISDTWAATPKLSVNIGLRYELNTPVNEHWGRASLFNFTAPGGFQTLSPGQQLFASHLDTFAPRLGIAYRLTHRDVIRAGFGIFLDNSPQLNNTFEATNPPFLVIESFTSSKTNPLLLSNPFPTGSLVVGGVPSPSMGQYTAGIPTVNDWTVDFQHSFARNLLLDVGYVGNRASHFGRTMTANVPLVPGPSAIQARRPLPGFGPVRYFQFDDYSTYEALQARLEKRFSNGVSLLVSYTWSKTLDLSSEELAGGTIDPNNLDRDYGPADFNQPQNLAISYVYRLPVGKGNRFLPSMNWVGQEILGGWAVSGITRYQTGFPLTIAALGDVANEGLGTRPDRVCNGNLGGNATSAEWFNTSCFVNPAKYTFGNSGRGVLTDPGNKEWDIGMMKQFPTFKEQHLEFRLDMFNAFNIVNLSGPGATVGAAGFGEILSAGAGRTLQFALKYYF